MNKEFQKIVDLALDEDLGSGDVSASLLADKQISATIICRESAVICGIEFAQATFALLDKDIKISWQAKDGDLVEPSQILATIKFVCVATELSVCKKLSATRSPLIIDLDEPDNIAKI